MKKISRSLLLALAFILTLSGCTSLLKLTYQNEDFKWVTPENLAKIVVQSTRDIGFRFVVTDADTIRELHESLAAAMPMEETNTMEPDYIFEFTTYDNEVRKFYYTSGVGTQEDGGNFYNDDKVYLVLNRIDASLIKNLFALRKPQDFFQGYYGSILEAARKVREDFPDRSLGIMINEDKEMLKFQMSYEILDFNLELNGLGIHPVYSDRETDVVMNIRTRGYKTNLYKALVEVRDNINKKTIRYYILASYANEAWTTQVSDELPEGF